MSKSKSKLKLKDKINTQSDDWQKTLEKELNEEFERNQVKKNIPIVNTCVPVNSAKILDIVDRLPLFEYTLSDSQIKHLGALPKDWQLSFPNLKDDSDMVGVSFASIKALSQMVSTMWQTAIALNARVEALELAERTRILSKRN